MNWQHLAIGLGGLFILTGALLIAQTVRLANQRVAYELRLRHYGRTVHGTQLAISSELLEIIHQISKEEIAIDREMAVLDFEISELLDTDPGL